MKKLFLILMALALVCSCQNPTPVQLEMEAYAKAHIANPDSYKFDYMGVEKEYKYVNDLYTYRQGLEEQAAKGSDVEIRTVNGIEMLVYRVMDEADGAPCIGYAFVDGTQIVEVFFWYATQEAADLTKRIIETIRVNNS